MGIAINSSSLFLLRDDANLLPLAAWIVQACGVVGNIARRASASLFNGADGILGTVREFVAVGGLMSYGTSITLRTPPT